MLSVVVPCRNEEDVLVHLVEQMFSAIEGADTDIETVRVDDGCRDRTMEVIRELNDHDHRVR